MSVLGTIARVTESRRVWFHWNFLASIVIIFGHRDNLRKNNQADTEVTPPVPPKAENPVEFGIADGSYNDLGQPWVGMTGTRFGRNVALDAAFGETGETLMTPSPRPVSNKLLKRSEFIPVPHLNVLAAAWNQFMVHDWLSLGPNDKERPLEIPLPEGDDWGDSMEVLGTTRPPPDQGRPQASINTKKPLVGRQPNLWLLGRTIGTDTHRFRHLGSA